ncbi:MAG: esterase [Saprospirales bacterium]|nr:MAG: esterase [Saprospirales bacterium]
MNKYLLGWIPVFVLLIIGCADIKKNGNSDLPQVNWGEIKRVYFESEWVDDRYVDILLPEGYDKTETYPVIYMQDGQMLFDSTTTWNHQSWQMADILRELTKDEGLTKPIIVGIHNNGKKRFVEYFPAGVIDFIPDEIREEMLAQFPGEPLSDAYLQFLISELKPYIDEHFSTKEGPRNTYIVGANMGALISIYALCEYPSVFSAAACLSTHWLGPDSDDMILPTAYANFLKANLPAPMRHRIYFDLGDQGLDAYYWPFQQKIDSVMIGLGYIPGDDWLTVYSPGDDHNELSWSKRIGSAVKFLMRDR